MIHLEGRSKSEGDESRNCGDHMKHSWARVSLHGYPAAPKPPLSPFSN